MHWWDMNKKSFRWFSAIKNTYLHALVGSEHKIFLAIFSYRGNLLTCIGGTLTQSLLGDFQLSRILFDLHWWGLNTKSCRWFSAIKNIYWHALGWPEHKIVPAIFSYQEHLLTCIVGTLTQNLLGGFQLSRKHIDTHWWDLKTKSVRRFAAIKTTYCNALVGPQNLIFSSIFSYQEYFLTCIGVTWTKNRFVDFQLSRILIYMHWWDLNTKSFWRFSANEETSWHALAGL